MKILKMIYNGKEYSLMGNLKLDARMIYVFLDLDTRERIYFVKSEQEMYEQITDEAFIKKINNYVSPKSLDVVYGELDRSQKK